MQGGGRAKLAGQKREREKQAEAGQVGRGVGAQAGGICSKEQGAAVCLTLLFA